MLNKKEIQDGKVYKFKEYLPLKNYIQKFLNEFGDLSHFNSIEVEKLKKIDEYLRYERDSGFISSIFNDFFSKNYKNDNNLFCELGMVRICIPEKMITGQIMDYVNLLNNNIDPAQYSQTAVILQKNNGYAPPHRDLNRPHYTIQNNIWFPFHSLNKSDSLVFFPEAYQKNIFPNFLNDQLDYNKNSNLAMRASINYTYDQYNLGKHLQFELDQGDFLIFNSEQYHCSAKFTKKIRISAEVRFAQNCFDDNSHYKKNCFYSWKNFRHFNEKSIYFSFINKHYLKNQVLLFKYDQDILTKILLRDEKLSNFQFFLIRLLLLFKTNSFYFLEKLFDKKKFASFKIFFLIKYFLLSAYFLIFRLKFNPRYNYFSDKSHPFTQPVPKIFYELALQKLHNFKHKYK